MTAEAEKRNKRKVLFYGMMCLKEVHPIALKRSEIFSCVDATDPVVKTVLHNHGWQQTVFERMELFKVLQKVGEKYFFTDLGLKLADQWEKEIESYGGRGLAWFLFPKEIRPPEEIDNADDYTSKPNIPVVLETTLDANSATGTAVKEVVVSEEDLEVVEQQAHDARDALAIMGATTLADRIRAAHNKNLIEKDRETFLLLFRSIFEGINLIHKWQKEIMYFYQEDKSDRAALKDCILKLKKGTADQEKATTELNRSTQKLLSAGSSSSVVKAETPDLTDLREEIKEAVRQKLELFKNDVQEIVRQEVGNEIKPFVQLFEEMLEQNRTSLLLKGVQQHLQDNGKMLSQLQEFLEHEGKL